MTDPNSTLPLVQAYKEIDRLKAELDKAKHEGGMEELQELNHDLSEKVQEIDALKAQNAGLSAARISAWEDLGRALNWLAVHDVDKAYDDALRAHVALERPPSTALRDLLAPTVELLDEWRFQLQNALNQKTCLVLDAVDLDKIIRELARLRARTEGKV